MHICTCYNLISFYISGANRGLASAPLVPLRGQFVAPPAVLQQIARAPGNYGIQQQPGTARQVLQGIAAQPTLQQQHYNARQQYATQQRQQQRRQRNENFNQAMQQV